VATVEFVFTGVPRRYPELVQQRAVLVPYVGHAVEEMIKDDDALVEQVRLLVARWRQRVHMLAMAGWDGLAGDEPKAVLARTYACNCQPTFALTAQKTRPCRKRDVCPFCAARQVREIWVAIDHAFFADQASAKAKSGAEQGKLPRYKPSSYDLVERTIIIECPPRVEGKDALPLLIDQAVKSRPKRMKETTGLPGVRGAYETLFVRLTREGNWHAEIRVIVMALRGFSVPQSWSAPSSTNAAGVSNSFKVNRHENPTRNDVLNAVARACRYPTFLLRGDPAAVVALLRLRKGRKLSEAYGAFRNKAAQRRDAGD
jgi:hypothetical protein